jgi:hypothetical protein
MSEHVEQKRKPGTAVFYRQILLQKSPKKKAAVGAEL